MEATAPTEKTPRPLKKPRRYGPSLAAIKRAKKYAEQQKQDAAGRSDSDELLSKMLSETDWTQLKMYFCLKMGAEVLLRKASDGKSNFVFSPLSLHLIFTLLAAAYKGVTLNEILSMLGYDSIDDVNLAATRLMGLLIASERREIVLSFINGAWIDEKFQFKPGFEETANGVCNALVKSVNFRSNCEAVRLEVNSWAENATKGIIRQILPPGCLDKDTVSVFANALYFKGAWDKKFRKYNGKKDFYLLNGDAFKVPFMTRSDWQFYGEFDGYKSVKIPYLGGQDARQFAMYFLLPDDKDGLPKLVQMANSNPGFFRQEFGLSRQQLEDFLIPKFKFSFGFEALDAMKEIGHELPFKNIGDLTEAVVDDDSLSDILYIPKIFQKSFIDVNEQGTEAATVIACGMRMGAARRPEPPKLWFVADHPFIFMLREETSKVAFFIGAVLDPRIN